MQWAVSIAASAPCMRICSSPHQPSPTWPPCYNLPLSPPAPHLPHSYLGYGLMAARAKVIEAGADSEKGHPCFSKVGCCCTRHGMARCEAAWWQCGSGAR